MSGLHPRPRHTWRFVTSRYVTGSSSRDVVHDQIVNVFFRENKNNDPSLWKQCLYVPHKLTPFDELVLAVFCLAFRRFAECSLVLSDISTMNNGRNLSCANETWERRTWQVCGGCEAGETAIPSSFDHSAVATLLFCELKARCNDTKSVQPYIERCSSDASSPETPIMQQFQSSSCCDVTDSRKQPLVNRRVWNRAALYTLLRSPRVYYYRMLC